MAMDSLSVLFSRIQTKKQNPLLKDVYVKIVLNLFYIYTKQNICSFHPDVLLMSDPVKKIHNQPVFFIFLLIFHTIYAIASFFAQFSCF